MKRILFIILALLITQNVHSQNMNKLTWLTEDFPPYNYVENKELKGACVEIVKRIMSQDNPNIVKDIHVLPWSVAYNRAIHEENVALFTTSFLKSRENLFQWVGPIAISKKNAITLKGNNQVNIQSHSDLKKYKWGAIQDDEGHLLLTKYNVEPTKIHTTNNTEELFKLLFNHKVDAIAYEPTAAAYHLEKHKQSGEIQSVFTIKSNPMYIAISKDTNDQIVNELQTRLHKLRGIHIK